MLKHARNGADDIVGSVFIHAVSAPGQGFPPPAPRPFMKTDRRADGRPLFCLCRTLSHPPVSPDGLTSPFTKPLAITFPLRQDSNLRISSLSETGSVTKRTNRKARRHTIREPLSHRNNGQLFAQICLTLPFYGKFYILSRKKSCEFIKISQLFPQILYCFCFRSLALISSTKVSGEVTLIIGPKDKMRMTSSVSSDSS